MKRLTIIFPILFFNALVQSQNIWFQDDFVNNNNGWEIISEEFLKTSVKNGSYVIDKLSVDRFQTLKKIYINPSKDFSVACEMSMAGQKETNEYGLVWGVKDMANCNIFTICSAGNIFIRQYKDEKETIIYKGTAPKLIKPDKKPNRLSIEKKGGQISFSVNDSILYSTEFSKFPFYKPNVGFEITGYSKVNVLSFVLKQDNTIKLVENMPKGVKKKNLGPAVNSKFNEAAPVISADGKTLYLAVKGDPKNVTADFLDIWYSTVLNDTAWTKRKNISKPINNDNHNWVISISPDNNMLTVSNRYNKDGSYKPEIGISKVMRTKTGWSIPTPIIIRDFDNLSKSANYNMSPDGKVMILAIETPESGGDLDLYVSFLQGDTTWSKPRHLRNVNSFGRECTPFVAADGATMYFSTNGRPGYGDNDLFVTTRQDTTWLNWSEPCNLGPEINTPNFDADYSMPASGAFAMMVSRDHTIGGSDIFRVELPKQAKPKPVILIKGRVVNDITKQPIVANISYYDLLTDLEAGIAVSSPVDGSYQVVLPPGTDYSMMARKDGFISQSEHIYAIEIAEYTEMEIDLHLIPMEVGVTVQLKNIFFETGKGVIKDESGEELNKFLKLLLENPSLVIEIGGHTDNVGAEEANLALSRERAEAIKKFLELGGVDSKRLTAVGYGPKVPIASNSTEDGRSQNRRVEFKIIKK